MPASSREKFCHLLLDVRCLSCNFLIFKNKIVLWKKKNKTTRLKFYNYSTFPSVGFYFFSVHSGLDPARSCVCSNKIPMDMVNSIWKLMNEWFWNIAVFLFKDIGCLSNTYHWGLVESEDIFPMKITPFQSSWASKHRNEKRSCVNAEYDWVCSEEISYTEIHKSELHRPKDCIAIGNWEHYGSARILRSYSR